MATKSSVQKPEWLFVTFAAFFFFLLIVVLLMVYGQQLNLSTPLYFFLLLAMAMACTGLLAGALKSKASYDGKIYGGNLKLGGPAVVFALIILLGYKFRPLNEIGPRLLTINIYADKNKTPVTSGKVLIKAGAFSQREEITSKGEAVFGGIGTSISGKVLSVLTEVDGFTNPAVDSIFVVSPTNNTSIDLFLMPITHKIMLRGFVLNKANKPLGGVLVDIGHGLLTTHTDSMGNFAGELLLKEGSKQEVTVIKNGKIIYNSARTLSNNNTLTLPVDE